MSIKSEIKPYLSRVKNWKIRNIVMLYLEAREGFKNYRGSSRRGDFLSFDKLREICEILFDIKEEHHLIYKRLIDPKKNKFEKGHKILPNEIETQFMNNIGLLFHKVMVARELKYVMEHYVEESDAFQKNEESLHTQVEKIDALFEEGIHVLTSLVKANKDNILLLTLLLEDPKRTKRHFGKDTRGILEQFGNGGGMAEVYFSVGQYCVENGWPEKAKKMFESALKEKADHNRARSALADIN